MDKLTKFIPVWVKVAVALALGLGTMIGWKRIVVTVGEKIGKEHLTYAQGASAELVAMGTILAADNLGLPVSTTHVLSRAFGWTVESHGLGFPTCVAGMRRSSRNAGMHRSISNAGTNAGMAA